MSKEKGSAILVSAGGSSVGAGKSNSVSVQRSLIERTTKDSEWKGREYGRLSWSVSAEGVIAPDDAGQIALFAAIQAGTSVALAIGKSTPGVGDRVYSGSGLATAYNESFEENNDSAFDCEIEGSGAFTITTT